MFLHPKVVSASFFLTPVHWPLRVETRSSVHLFHQLRLCYNVRKSKLKYGASMQGQTKAQAADATPPQPQAAAPTNTHEYTGRRGRLALLRSLARAVWDAVEITHIATFNNHCFPCLALCFVPSMPSTLVWVEESSRVHVCNVLQPSAHQVVHLRTLPMQMAFAQNSAYHVPDPLCAEDNWGFGSDLGDDAVEFQVCFYDSLM